MCASPLGALRRGHCDALVGALAGHFSGSDKIAFRQSADLLDLLAGAS
jgi:hypothetical protein